MCGITGVFKKNNGVGQEVLRKMISQLKHRGPNDQSVWVENNIGLAHARLSIQDLSTTANQPMFSESGRFVIVFNGEIYNYLELRKELQEQHSLIFKTHGDTEVLVNAIELWGLEKTLKKCVGMFAFAAWDRRNKRLFLARDRFGEKPLYYGLLGSDFVFASELKSIDVAYHDQLHINRDVLATYMNFCYVPTPFCIYAELKKLEPGSYLVVNSDLTVDQQVYWSAIDVALEAKKNPLNISFLDAANQLEEKLKHTLSEQMLSDVPLGAFLSGGVDSSTIVALMQSLSNKPIKTFSIGFKEKAYDESAFAKAVADHLGTDHTQLLVSDNDAMAVIPKLSSMYDEPFADSSQIPTYLVSQLAKKSVTVSLSGDAGDEIFGGYNRYFLAHRVYSVLSNPLINRLVRLCPEKLIDCLDYFPQKKIAHVSQKIKKVKTIAQLVGSSFSHMYEGFCIQEHGALVLHGTKMNVLNRPRFSCIFQEFSDVEMMMLLDTLNYLTDDILVKVDRAGMAVSLETRVPFLDHRIFEYAWSLPEKYKVESGRGKLILREVLHRYVPQSLIERPKMGFGIPLGEWLNGGLKDWAEDLLSENQLKQQGFLDPDLVRRYWREHQSGKRDRQWVLWNILMFQQWLDKLHS